MAQTLLPRAVLSALVKAGICRDVAPGTTLFSRGGPADTMLIVDAGHVDVHLGDGEPPKRFEAGSLIGALALLTPSGVRTATVTGGTRCRITVIEREQFEKILRERPELAYPTLRNACTYLIDSELRLVDDLRRRNAELEGALDYLRRTREELDATELKAQTDALTHGHPAGDAVLRGVAGVLRRSVRATDLLCRIGGDEFAVLLAPAAAEATPEAARTAARIRQAIAANEVHVPECVLRVGATVGGTFSMEGDSPDSLLARADKHLYAAKAAGRNLVCWDGEMLRDV